MATTLTRIRPSGIDPVAEFTFDSIATSTVVVGNVAISDSGNGNIQVASVAANGQIGTPAAIGGANFEDTGGNNAGAAYIFTAQSAV